MSLLHFCMENQSLEMTALGLIGGRSSFQSKVVKGLLTLSVL